MQLSSPNDDDGAVLIAIYGGPVDSVESIGYPIYSARSADTLKLIVTGSLGSGPIARIHVPDNREVARYVTRIGQVAARRTYTPHDPAMYTITLQQ